MRSFWSSSTFSLLRSAAVGIAPANRTRYAHRDPPGHAHAHSLARTPHALCRVSGAESFDVACSKKVVSMGVPSSKSSITFCTFHNQLFVYTMLVSSSWTRPTRLRALGSLLACARSHAARWGEVLGPGIAAANRGPEEVRESRRVWWTGPDRPKGRDNGDLLHWRERRGFSTEIPQIHINVDVLTTPNDDAVKLMPGCDVTGEVRTVSIRRRDLVASTDDTALLQLARQLLTIPGLKGLLFGYDFITLEKESSAEWETIEAAAVAVVEAAGKIPQKSV